MSTNAFEEFYPGSAAIVLTPRCELEHKADFVTLAAVCSPSSVAMKMEWKTLGQLRNHLNDILKNKEYRWHYLAKFPGFAIGALVDYQLVLSSEAAVLDDLEVVATVKDVFREQVAQRYATYAGRVGTDDLVPPNELEPFRNTIIDAVFKEVQEQLRQQEAEKLAD